MEEKLVYLAAQYGPRNRVAQSPLSRRGFLGLAAASCVAVSIPASAAPEGPAVFEARVDAVIDGHHLRLSDGREVLLPHILPPGADRHVPMTDKSPIRQAASALADRVLGKTVRVDLALPGLDRYGRLRARVADQEGDVAEAMAKLGMVRVFPEPDADPARIASLLASETLARQSRAGFWGDGVFTVHRADLPDQVAGDHFQILRGTPLKVSRIGARDHLEFGEDWRTDVTVGIARAAKLDPPPDSLVGRLVEARGWVRSWNGPFMEVTQAVQITLPPTDP